MKFSVPVTTTLLTVFMGSLLVSPTFAQDKHPASGDAKASAAAAPSDDDMAKMMALAQPGENHKLLAFLDGAWKYTLKMYMAAGAPASESTGTALGKPTMGGRYFISDVSGKFQYPGPDGQMQDVAFKGMATEGYDNVKQKFVSTWIDNMGTSIMLSEGTYDPANKTFTYEGEEEPAPGMKTKLRQTTKIIDHDHYVTEMYENHGGKEVKTVEIDYSR